MENEFVRKWFRHHLRLKMKNSGPCTLPLQQYDIRSASSDVQPDVLDAWRNALNLKTIQCLKHEVLINILIRIVYDCNRAIKSLSCSAVQYFISSLPGAIWHHLALTLILNTLRNQYLLEKIILN